MARQRTRHVYVADQLWKVRFSCPLRSDDGVCDYRTKTISLRAGLHGIDLLDTILHELIHARWPDSAVKHVATGARLCTQEEIDARYAICQACEHFANGACAKCGCPLVREKQYISKLAWASEKCPVGKWGPVGGGPESPLTPQATE